MRRTKPRKTGPAPRRQHATLNKISNARWTMRRMRRRSSRYGCAANNASRGGRRVLRNRKARARALDQAALAPATQKLTKGFQRFWRPFWLKRPAWTDPFGYRG